MGAGGGGAAACSAPQNAVKARGIEHTVVYAARKHRLPRSDVYALGATLYHLVTGVAPFPGDNHLDVVEKKKQGDFTPAGKLNPEVPEALDRILTLMLAPLPRDRYQTASELIIPLDPAPF